MTRKVSSFWFFFSMVALPLRAIRDPPILWLVRDAVRGVLLGVFFRSASFREGFLGGAVGLHVRSVGFAYLPLQRLIVEVGVRLGLPPLYPDRAKHHRH